MFTLDALTWLLCSGPRGYGVGICFRCLQAQGICTQLSQSPKLQIKLSTGTHRCTHSERRLRGVSVESHLGIPLSMCEGYCEGGGGARPGTRSGVQPCLCAGHTCLCVGMINGVRGLPWNMGSWEGWGRL